jgi:hypothetical protein
LHQRRNPTTAKTARHISRAGTEESTATHDGECPYSAPHDPHRFSATTEGYPMGSRAGFHHNAGTVIGDTASGAVSGAAVGGPVGAVVGGGVGFLTGLLTGDSPDDPAAPEAPPPPPDVADELSQRAALAKQMRLMASGTGDFLSGPLGNTSKAPGAAPKAGGY